MFNNGAGAKTHRNEGAWGLNWETSQIFDLSGLLAPNAGGVKPCLVYVGIGWHTCVSKAGVSSLLWLFVSVGISALSGRSRWVDRRRAEQTDLGKAEEASLSSSEAEPAAVWISTDSSLRYSLQCSEITVLCTERLHYSRIHVGISPFDFVSGTIPNLCSNWRM